MNVSFVIPCYYSRKTILKTIQSIVDQTQPSYEIIVVLNGPDDGSNDAIRIFEQVKVLQLPTANRALARNAGAAAAKGKLIAFVDSDVVLDPQWLAHAVECFERNRFIDILSTAVIPAGDEKDLLYDFRRAYRSWLSKGSFLSLVKPATDGYTLSPVINTAACVCRRRLFEVLGGFDPHFKREEDAEFSLRAYVAGAALFSEQKSISHVHSGSLADSWIRYFRRYAELGPSSARFTRKWPINGPRIKFQMLARFYRHTGRLDLTLILLFCKTIHVVSYSIAKVFVTGASSPITPTNYALHKTMQMTDGNRYLAPNTRILATDSQIQIELLGTNRKFLYEGTQARMIEEFLRTGQASDEDIILLKENNILIESHA